MSLSPMWLIADLGLMEVYSNLAHIRMYLEWVDPHFSLGQHMSGKGVCIYIKKKMSLLKKATHPLSTQSQAS